jgi:hypothetical protein
MRKILLLGAALAVALTVPASAQLYDDFDSYADQAAFNAVWSGNMSLTNNNWVSAPNSIYQGTVAQQSYRFIGTGIPLQQLYFGFDFYDERGTASLARTYGMVYARQGTSWSGSLNQIIAVGKYNSIATTKYNARIAFGSLNWFVLDQGPDRSVGWHRAEVIGGVDPNDATKAKVDIYIDGILGKTVTGLTNDTFNWVVMGSNLSSSHGMYFDNVVVRVIPEPVFFQFGTMAVLGALGLKRTSALRSRKTS